MSFTLKSSDTHELVKVVARVRPLNSHEKANGEIMIVNTDLERNEVLVSKLRDENANPMMASSKTEIKPFTFDAVIDNSLSQKQVYDKVFKSLVNSVVEGFNGTIFAYGQTGTGKTFTMEGSLDSEHEYGVMPNAFKHIFDQITTNRERRYLIGVSYFEIYQEEIRDLLDMEIMKKCVIHESPNGGVHIKGLSSYLCSNFTEISDLMAKGKKNRVVGATNMNEHSSRSHSVFQVTVETSDKFDVDDGGDHIKVGKLNLVDLAGSERVSKTGAEGQRLKEASKINLSLSTLGNVISALVDGAPFIPYRDSKLTRILQDSLGGNSRTLMIATVGPSAYNYEETVNTLRYATRAKNIENKPRLNVDPKDAVLRKYQEEINRLRSMVEQQKAARQNSATKPSTADEGKMKCNNKRENKSNSNSGFNFIQDMTKINELKEMLEPLGIHFDGGDIEGIRAKLKEKTESLENNTKMVKEEKEKIAAALQNATNKLQSAEYECNNLIVQIKWLESKVLNSSGENYLLQKMKSQKEQIEQKEKELETHKMRQEHLKKVLAEKEMTNEEAFATSNALENDYRVNLEKLGKITRKITGFGSDYAAVRKKHAEDSISLKHCIEEMRKELKLKKTIVDNFVPRKIRKDIEQRMRYDSKNDQYFLESFSTDQFSRVGRPRVDNMLKFPLFNLTQFSSLQPMDNTFFTNENVLLLAPDNNPIWPSKPFIEDVVNPKVESLVKAAIKDINNTMIINCDHKGSKLRIGQNDLPSYTAIGPSLLLKSIRSEKFIDYSIVPSNINLPCGSNIFPIQIPQKSSSGKKFTQQQLLAFPMIKYSVLGELSFEDEDIIPKPSKHNQHSHQKSTSIPKRCFTAITAASDLNIPVNINPTAMIQRSPQCRPKTSRPTLSAQKGTFEPQYFRPAEMELRKSVDPYELESEQEDRTVQNIPEEMRNHQTDEERILQRLQYFASRNESKKQRNYEFQPNTTIRPPSRKHHDHDGTG